MGTKTYAEPKNWLSLNITLVEDKDNHHTVIISPWVFQQSEINLVYEGRLLQQTFNDEIAMQEALANDCWVTLSTSLIPA